MMEFGIGLAVGALTMLAVIVLATPRRQDYIPPSVPPEAPEPRKKRRNMHS